LFPNISGLLVLHLKINFGISKEKGKGSSRSPFSILSQCIYTTSLKTNKTGKPVSLKNVIDEAVKIILLNLDP